MKIAYVCNEYPPAAHGGIGTFVYTQAHGLKALGHQVTVVGWGDRPGERDDQGVRVVMLAACRIPFIAWRFNRKKLANWLSRESQEGNIDIIETCDFQGPLIDRFEKVPVVVRLHLTETIIRKHAGKKRWDLIPYCEKKQLSMHPSWIAVSRYALDSTREVFGVEPTESRTIYSPVGRPTDVKTEVPSLPGKFVLFAGGMVSRRKGALVLAEAAVFFLRRKKDMNLVFVGSLEMVNGIPIDRTIRAILGPELSRRVFFLGRLTRNQVLAVMRKAVVFSYPSTLETFGLVIAEAMLQGCPVVVCSVGPIPEFVRNEKTGLMVSPNDPAALSEAIGRLLGDKALAKRLSDGALRQVISRFSLKKSTGESLDFYRTLIKSKTEADGWEKLAGLTPALKLPKDIFKRMAPGIYGRMRSHFHRESRLYRTIVHGQGLVVGGGPFKGMKYIQDSRGSRLIPKLLGSYESELHPFIEKVISHPPRVIVDIGCAEGYYAVGLSRLLPKIPVYAYDVDPESQKMCRELAELNGVAERIQIRGGCDADELKKLNLRDSFILCDCEGYERELLNPKKIPGLKKTRMLVELHEMLSEGLTREMADRYRRTHDMFFIDVQKRDPDRFLGLKGLSKHLQALALYERETLAWAPQQWVYMVPFKDNKD